MTGNGKVRDLAVVPVVDGNRLAPLTDAELDRADWEEKFEIANLWGNEFKQRLGFAMDAAINMGRALISAKEELGHGRFLGYIDTHFRHGSEDTAERYMLLAENSAHVRNMGPETSMRGALAEIRAIKKAEKEARNPTPEKPAPNTSGMNGHNNGSSHAVIDVPEVDITEDSDTEDAATTKDPADVLYEDAAYILDLLSVTLKNVRHLESLSDGDDRLSKLATLAETMIHSGAYLRDDLILLYKAGNPRVSNEYIGTKFGYDRNSANKVAHSLRLAKERREKKGYVLDYFPSYWEELGERADDE